MHSWLYKFGWDYYTENFHTFFVCFPKKNDMTMIIQFLCRFLIHRLTIRFVHHLLKRKEISVVRIFFFTAQFEQQFGERIYIQLILLHKFSL